MASASDDGTVRVWGPAPFLDSQEADALNGKKTIARALHPNLFIV